MTCIPAQAHLPHMEDRPCGPRPHLAPGLGPANRISPARLVLRLAVVAAVSAAAVAVAGWAPATPALITGALTWLLLTARHDLAPPP